MRLTRYTHSCVRLELNGAVLVIDPGIWSEPSALHGADGVLVTHEHVDHVDVLRLRGMDVPVVAPAGADLGGLAVTTVSAGQDFTAAGLRVSAVGGRHAPVAAGQPTCANLGYLIEDALYHPGDALAVPARPVDTLLVPMQASWLKTAEAIDFMHAVGPPPGGRRPRRPGQRPGPPQSQRVAAGSGRHGLPLACARDVDPDKRMTRPAMI